MGVDAYDLMNQEAAQSPIGANKLLYAALSDGRAHPAPGRGLPGRVLRPQRPCITSRDLLRAVMEGVTYSLQDCLDILRGMGGTACADAGLRRRREAAPSGGRCWRMCLICPVATTVSTEGPALGAAILAGVGAGLYPSVEEACREMIRVNPAQQPMAENVPQYARVYEVYRKLYGANRELFKELAKL